MTRRPAILLALALSTLIPSISPTVATAQTAVVDGALPSVQAMSPEDLALALARAGIDPESADPLRDPTPAPDRASPDPAAVRATLAERRRAHLDELRRYVAAGEFPVNTYQPGFLNVFQDGEGHLCAVANLMRFDGELEMVQATAASTNFVALRDVHEGPLHDWILASGFTQEEIAMIQEPYFFQEEVSSQRQMQQQLEEEKARLRRVLGRVIRRLERGGRRSLDLAADRLLAAQHA